MVPVLLEGLEAVDLKVLREEILHQADLEAVALVQVQQGEALVQEEQLVGGLVGASILMQQWEGPLVQAETQGDLVEALTQMQQMLDLVLLVKNRKYIKSCNYT